VRKIIFIEPKSPNLHFFSQFLLPRLGVFILGAIVKEKGWNAEAAMGRKPYRSTPWAMKLRAIRLNGLQGMTSNPSIFEKTIAGCHDLDADIRAMALEGVSSLLSGKGNSDCSFVLCENFRRN
jgi:hypothetical protein